MQPTNFIVTNYIDVNNGMKIVSGMIGSTVVDTVTSCISSTQKITALSSTESEYMALSKCDQELKFVSILLGEIGTGVVQESILEDNKGPIFPAKNQQESMWI